MASTKLVWFITGANSGFGLLLTQLLLSHGHTVIATARSASKFPQSLKDDPKADLVEIEIAGPASAITAAVDAAVARHGRIDVLVNNAGFGLIGTLKEVTEADARYQFNVNFFGLLNFTKAVLPHMRAQNSGVIVHMSSSAVRPMTGASAFAVFIESFCLNGTDAKEVLLYRRYLLTTIFRAEHNADVVSLPITSSILLRLLQQSHKPM